MITAYEGSKPYIFISYSHRNKDLVLSVIEALQKDGFRVWFDAGIEAGSEWPENIAAHLRNCACMLTFVSRDFVKSHNCRRELNFAQDLEKPLLNIYIEDVELSDGMRMQLGLNQALWMKNFSTTADFLRAVCNARLIRDCKEVPSAEVQPVENDVPVKEAPSIPAEPKKEAPAHTEEKVTAYPSTKTFLSWTTSLIQLSYIFFGPFFLNLITGSKMNVWLMIVLMALPQIALCVINNILFKTVGKKLEDFALSDVASTCCFWWAVAIPLAVIVGIFYVASTANFFLRILISIGLNIVPSIASMFIIGSYDSRS